MLLGWPSSLVGVLSMSPLQPSPEADPSIASQQGNCNYKPSTGTPKPVTSRLPKERQQRHGASMMVGSKPSMGMKRSPRMLDLNAYFTEAMNFHTPPQTYYAKDTEDATPPAHEDKPRLATASNSTLVHQRSVFAQRAIHYMLCILCIYK